MSDLIPISKIGSGQLVDVECSPNEVHDHYFRTCTVLKPIKGAGFESNIGDTTPAHMMQLFGKDIGHWNRHFVVQVAGCPFSCWYCYVDNLKPDKEVSIEFLVRAFKEFRRIATDLNVFHLMGGAPGRYSPLWRDIRTCLDDFGCHDVIFLSDVILVEHQVFGTQPWNDIPERSLISVCLKGSNFTNFKKNTGVDAFLEAVWELSHYWGRPYFHFSAIGYEPKDEESMRHIVSPNGDLMRVHRYHVVEERLKKNSSTKQGGK